MSNEEENKLRDFNPFLKTLRFSDDLDAVEQEITVTEAGICWRLSKAEEDL